jgi:hypothetical protein
MLPTPVPELQIHLVRDKCPLPPVKYDARLLVYEQGWRIWVTCRIQLLTDLQHSVLFHPVECEL